MIAAVEALRYLTDEERIRLLARAEARIYEADECILPEGEPHEEIYILIKGAARVEKTTPTGTVCFDRMGPGEAFGEMSLLDGEPTSSAVVADESSEVFVFHLASIADLLEDDPTLAANLYHSLAVTLARRLRERNRSVQ
jgi:CRP/FNR family cyclic AMP-dependent transcriptional regulator